MNCPQCQSPIQEDQRICPNCGGNLEDLPQRAPLGPLPKLDLPPPPMPQQLKSDPQNYPSAGAPIEKPAPIAPAPESPAHAGELEPDDAATACLECGQVLNPSARFCPRCGTPVPNNQPEAAPSEIILGVIPNGVWYSGFSQDIYHLIVTNQRIIFAHQTGKMIRQKIRRLKEDAKKRKEKIPAEVYDDWFASYGDEYLEMPPQAILDEQSKNFYFPNDQVLAIETGSQEDEDTGETTYRIQFETSRKEIQCLFIHLNVAEARRLLIQNLKHVLR